MSASMPAVAVPPVAVPGTLTTADAHASAATVDARFLLVAAAEPGLLPRVVEAFAKLGTFPSRVHASAEAGDGSEMTIDLRLNETQPRTAELIELGLRRVVGVRQLIAALDRGSKATSCDIALVKQSRNL
jgi:hypothetical protein